MKKTSFAIVGCGNISRRHAEQIQRVGILTAVCDIIHSKADDLAAEYGASAYYNIIDLLNNEPETDVVCICTPNGLHAAHSISCLDAGKNVLCEKPLSIRVVDAQAMIDAARRSGRKLYVVKSTRYNPSVQALKEMLSTQHLGRIFSFQLDCFWNRPDRYYENSWRGSAQLDGGTLFTQFSHYLDVLYWLLGEVRDVSGWRANLHHPGVIDFEDTGVACLQMENGAIGGINWSVNTYRKNMEVSLTLLAEKGTVKLGGEYMNMIAYQSIDGAALNAEDGSNRANDYGFYKGSMSNHDKVYENLVKALQDDDHPFADGYEGMKTVELIEKIYQNIPLEKF